MSHFNICHQNNSVIKNDGMMGSRVTWSIYRNIWNIFPRQILEKIHMWLEEETIRPRYYKQSIVETEPELWFSGICCDRLWNRWSLLYQLTCIRPISMILRIQLMIERQPFNWWGITSTQVVSITQTNIINIWLLFHTVVSMSMYIKAVVKYI